MPQTRLARNQRLRRDRQTEPEREVIPLCNRSGQQSNSKNLWERFRAVFGASVASVSVPLNSSSHFLQPLRILGVRRG
jgi:hypothetical protein